MNLAHLSPFANHLWQSTLFAGFAMLLSLTLRRNQAQFRHWLWLAASIKFLVPCSVLMMVGGLVSWQTAPAVRPPITVAITDIAQPFAAPPPVAIAGQPESHAFPLPPELLAAVWFLGFAALMTYWFVRWLRIWKVLRNSKPLPIGLPIEARSSASLVEPGIFGIVRPVLLLPEGIEHRLTPPQFRAILAHELCHVRRRDNLAAALHMVVEAMFWFHPLVWWIGSRLVEERECACDEEVMRLGADPEVYASGILNVCKFFVESPLPCAAGATGADLKRRVESIMSKRVGAGLSGGRKLLLAAAGLATIAFPVGIGLVNAPKTLAQTPMSTTLAFEVASIKPTGPGTYGSFLHLTPGNGLSATGVTLKSMIAFSYGVEEFQLSGGPAWYGTERYDILAKPDKPEGPSDLEQATREERRLMAEHLHERTRRLLADRFHLVLHRSSEEGPVYLLLLGKGGVKMKDSDEKMGVSRNPGRMVGRGATMEMLIQALAGMLRHPVVDRTGLKGTYGFQLEWTPETAPNDGGLVDPNQGTGPSIFTAIQEQLGLKLELGKAPIDKLIIDRAERPSAN